MAVGILTFIMIKIVPAFDKIFDDFELDLPRDDRAADRHLRMVRRVTGT